LAGTLKNPKLVIDLRDSLESITVIGLLTSSASLLMSDKKNLELIGNLLLNGEQEKAINKLDECFSRDPEDRDIVEAFRTNYNEWLADLKSNDNYQVSKAKIKKRIQSFIDSYTSAQHTLLYVFSNPKNKAQLGFQGELRAILEALSTQGPFKINSEPEMVPAITQQEFFDQIRQRKPNLLLLSMHGDRDKGFYFLDSNGNESVMSPEKLINDIKAAIDFSDVPLECVILNCCNSAAHARELAMLVPFTVGMDGLIYNEAAGMFVGGFLKNLILTGDYDKSFDAGIYEISQDEGLQAMKTIPQKFHKR